VALLELVGLGLLVVLGIIIIVVVGALLFLLPALVVAFVVWLITRNELLTGIAFLLVALVSIAKRR
jgi:hypothetical protein